MPNGKKLVAAATGEPVAITFTAGLPKADDGPVIFLLDDYSLCEEKIDRKSENRPSGSLVCSDPYAIKHQPYEIALARVDGWAYAGPRSRPHQNQDQASDLGTHDAESPVPRFMSIRPNQAGIPKIKF